VTAQVGSLFETPVIVDTLPNAAALNAELAAVARTRRNADRGVVKSNWNGWQSTPDMLGWGGAAAATLARHFIALCQQFTYQAHPEAEPFRWFVEMWANISPPGAANESHCHPGAVWSAVYYVDDGYAGSKDPALGGELVLYDPRMPAVRMIPLDLRYRGPDGKIAQSQMAMRASAGRLVMFPPWLMHAVRPFNGTGERISIAMNANAVPEPAITERG
jgi:uncharacterized protein (TIGR02466 family)